MNPDQFIQILMNENNLESQDQLAQMLGISPTSISGWKERGQVPQKYLVRYSKLLNKVEIFHKPKRKVDSKHETLNTETNDMSIIHRDEHELHYAINGIQFIKNLKSKSLKMMVITDKSISRVEASPPNTDK